VIRGKGTFLHPNKVQLGEGVQIGRDAYFVAQGGIEIGDHCILSRGVTIRTQDHDYESDAVPFGSDQTYGPDQIGTAVWIGMNATIMPGVKIGDGAVIGYQSVVTSDIPAGGIAVGIPAKVKKYRDMDRFRENVAAGRFKSESAS